MEKRSIATEVRMHTDNDVSTIEGYAAVFNTRAEIGPGMFEEIKPGAFDERLKKGGDTLALFNHNIHAILGRESAGTLELTSDSHGLRYKIFPQDTQAGRDAVTSIKRGDVKGSSFSFPRVGNDDDFRLVEGGVLRTVTKFAAIGDVGPVVNPAYETASVSARSKEAFEAFLSHDAEQQEALDAESQEGDDPILIEHEARERELAMVDRG